MLVRCLAGGAGIGLVLGLLAGPGTDTGTGATLAILGALLGCGLGGLVWVALDAFDLQPPQRAPQAEPAVVPAIADDPGPLVPAGWYPDPSGGADKKYWDGERWGSG